MGPQLCPKSPGTDYEAAARDAGPTKPTYNNNDARQNLVATKSALQPTRVFVVLILTTIKPFCRDKLDSTSSQGPESCGAMSPMKRIELPKHLSCMIFAIAAP